MGKAEMSLMKPPQALTNWRIVTVHEIAQPADCLVEQRLVARPADTKVQQWLVMVVHRRMAVQNTTWNTAAVKGRD